MVERTHAVEDVGRGAGAAVEAGHRLGVRRVRVADRDDDAVGRRGRDDVERPGKLGRDDDHLHAAAARVQEPPELRLVRRAEVADVERPRALGADERALEVAAEDQRRSGGRAPGDGRDRPHRLHQPVLRAGHGRREQAGRAVPGVERRDLLDLVRVGPALRTATTVHMEVDESRGEARARRQPQDRRADPRRQRPRPDSRDPRAADVDPAVGETLRGREDSVGGEHDLGGG